MQARIVILPSKEWARLYEYCAKARDDATAKPEVRAMAAALGNVLDEKWEGRPALAKILRMSVRQLRDKLVSFGCNPPPLPPPPPAHRDVAR